MNSAQQAVVKTAVQSASTPPHHLYNHPFGETRLSKYGENMNEHGRNLRYNAQMLWAILFSHDAISEWRIQRSTRIVTRPISSRVTPRSAQILLRALRSILK